MQVSIYLARTQVQAQPSPASLQTVDRRQRHTYTDRQRQTRVEQGIYNRGHDQSIDSDSHQILLSPSVGGQDCG